MKRENFLQEYLGAYGADSIIITKTNKEDIWGTVIYDPNDPDERQDFKWDISEENAPSEPVYLLAKLLNLEKLLDIDKITVSRQELREKYNKRWKSNISVQDFDEVIDALESIRIRIFDDNYSIEANPYYIHE